MDRMFKELAELSARRVTNELIAISVTGGPATILTEVEAIALRDQINFALASAVLPPAD